MIAGSTLGATSGTARSGKLPSTDEPFTMPSWQRPLFANRTVSIQDHRAVPGGETLNLEAVQAAIDACHAAGGGTVLVPADGAVERAWRGLDPKSTPGRPRLLQPVECRNVLFEGFTAVNSPSWTINPVACENVIIRGLTLRAARPGPQPHAPNTDGINPDSCRNVLIANWLVE